MLTSLRVHNFAIINELSLDFQPGLNIITGETGSGKSLLIKSLSLLMGEKGHSDYIKYGCSEARVEGRFDISKRPDIGKRLQQFGLTEEGAMPDDLIVRRILSGEKNKTYINDQSVTLQTLRQLVFPLLDLTSQSAPLIEITGQFDNKNLLNKSFHLEILDSVTVFDMLLKKYRDTFASYQKTLEQITQHLENYQANQQQKDFIAFQIQEIVSAQLKPQEDQTLETAIKQLKNQHRLQHFYDEAKSLFDFDDHQSLLAPLRRLLKKQSEISTLDPNLTPWFQQLSTNIEGLNELAFQLEQLQNSHEALPESLDELQERLSLIRKLQKKYGPTIEDIFRYQSEREKQAQSLEHFEKQWTLLQAQKKELEQQLQPLAQELHLRRQQASEKLAQQVNQELLSLNMKGVTFHIELRALNQFNAHGSSEAEFQARASSELPWMPLNKVASGGELSRILLALKVVAKNEIHARTYLFDEVDSGVSGKTAEKVGRKLQQVSKNHQVICVTHLPQVASFAEAHFVIEKDPDSAQQVRAIALESHLRTQEVARLLSGEKITTTSLKQARELIQQAHQSL